jgi:hypothetical protein
MKRFEYDITLHPIEQFSRLAYLCTDTGECSAEQVPADERKILTDILNDHGVEGWELVQLVFSKTDVTAFWKRTR